MQTTTIVVVGGQACSSKGYALAGDNTASVTALIAFAAAGLHAMLE